ncbi:MAG: FoF1 ATP synthase subunit a [Dehalococcoidia bacterium]
MRAGCLLKAIIGGVVILGLAIVSLLFLPSPEPHVHLPAEEVFDIAGFPVTNCIIASWLAIVVLLVMFIAGSRRMTLVPQGWQNFIEWIYETLYNFAEQAAGPRKARLFFPLFATIFLYVVMAAWLSLLPGFDMFGWVAEGGEHAGTIKGAFAGEISDIDLIETPWLRKANSDINFPLAMALVAFLSWTYWAIRMIGIREYSKQFIKLDNITKGLKLLSKGDFKAAPMTFFMGGVDIFVGFLEFLSRCIQIISLTFRLFGNMLAGAILILVILYLVPWFVAIPFYGLELLFGFVQALIFAGLTLVFSVIATTPEAEHE